MLSTGAWLFVTASLLLVAGLAFAAGLLWSARREHRRAQQAAEAARALAGLHEFPIWHSDVLHRLCAPPWPLAAGAPEPAAGRFVWQQFSADGDEAALRQALDAQAPFGPLRVRRAGAEAVGWLHGRPRFDAEGRFGGHVGILRAAGDDTAVPARLEAVGAAHRGALLLAEGDGHGGWVLRHANPAARERFGKGGAMPAWNALREQLPRSVLDALPALAADGGAECDGWLLRRFAAGGGVDGLLLAETAPDGAAAAAEQASIGYTISHDMRAPIRVVEGFARILKEDYGRLLDRVANDHLDRVLGAAARMNQMIDATLALARLSTQPLARQPVNLSQMATYIVEDLRRSAPERVAEIEIEPALVVHGDPALLRMVLENLLGNAWKYSQRAPRARIAFGAEAQPGRRGFVVRDNGAGFDMRSAERLFGLFQRLHSASEFPGTGVGLASVKRIVQRHGGEIWAEAEPGRGAVFHFTLRD